MIRVISLGAGVQSSTVLLMALAGEFDAMPDAAIFADTQWEPEAVYDHLDYLQRQCDQAGLPLYRVSAGHIRDDVQNDGRFASLPFIVRGNGQRGIMRRQCTKEYKLQPIHRKIDELSDDGTAEMWLGISLDEAQRMKPSRRQSITNRYPLVELGMTRHACFAWLNRHNHPTPPKSACIGCPFHSVGYWRDMKRNRPDEWREAVEFDRHIRQIPQKQGYDGYAYLHSSGKPLEEAVDIDEDGGQMNLWDGECEGMCGV